MSHHSSDLAAVRGALLGLAVLAGCATMPDGTTPPAAPGAGAGADATPTRAILYRDTVTVEFSDGALCVAPRPAMARAWQGRLAGCAHLLGYTVTLPPGPTAPRRILMRLPEGGSAVIALETARFGLPAPGGA